MQFDHFNYNGLSVRYAARQTRNKRTPLLLFNGIGQSIEVLEPLIAALRGIPVVTMDVPGAGLSEVPRRPLRYCEHAAVARALLDHLQIDQVNVFGVSWGAGLAQQFAHQYRARVQHLILAAAPPGNMMVPGNPKVYFRMANLRRFWEDDYMHRIAGDIYGGDVRNDMSAVDELIRLLKAPTRRGYIYQSLAMLGWSSLPFLRRIKAPTLILQGNDDPMIPTINSRVMAGLIPNSRLEILNCGHLFILTRLKEITPMIKEFAYA